MDLLPGENVFMIYLEYVRKMIIKNEKTKQVNMNKEQKKLLSKNCETSLFPILL